MDCFLLQRLDMLNGNHTLIDSLLTNQEPLFDNVTTNGNLGYNNCTFTELKILVSTFKTSPSTKTLDFRTANFNIHNAQLQGIPWEVSVEGKGACKCLESFKKNLLEANYLSPMKGKEESRKRDHPIPQLSFGCA